MNTNHLTFESIDGVEIAIADYRGCTPEEFLQRLRVTSDWVVSQPTHSVLMITLAAGIGYSPDAMRSLVHMLRETKPYVRASAVVGLGHLSLLVRVINHLSGRSLRGFEAIDDAKRWLVDTALDNHA
ncbi:MAG: hypothetical protein WC538_19000 [Thermoanaerobaculia bacterium]